MDYIKTCNAVDNSFSGQVNTTIGGGDFTIANDKLRGV
jgi:hypothetical protein